MIIADTSVISSFAIVRRLDLLKKIFDKIYIPKGVLLEILESKDKVLITEVRKRIATSEELSDTRFISVFDTDDLTERVGRLRRDRKIGQGESEVIIVAKENNGVALLDDKHARSIAKERGVNLCGTLSLLRMFHKKGFIEKTELKHLLEDIISKGNLYVTSELYDWVLED